MKLMVTGHRPPRIGGYRLPNPVEQWVRAHIRVVLERLLARHKNFVAVSGMALGTDTIFVEEALKLSIPFTAAVPSEGQESRWPESSQMYYRKLLKQAHEVVLVDEVEEYKASTFRAQFLCRNRWMVDHSDMTLAVWDGSYGGTAHAVRTTWQSGRSVLCINPQAQTLSLLDPQPSKNPIQSGQ